MQPDFRSTTFQVSKLTGARIDKDIIRLHSQANPVTGYEGTGEPDSPMTYEDYTSIV